MLDQLIREVNHFWFRLFASANKQLVKYILDQLISKVNHFWFHTGVLLTFLESPPAPAAPLPDIE